jgi:hypothetical protein
VLVGGTQSPINSQHGAQSTPQMDIPQSNEKADAHPTVAANAPLIAVLKQIGVAPGAERILLFEALRDAMLILPTTNIDEGETEDSFNFQSLSLNDGRQVIAAFTDMDSARQLLPDRPLHRIILHAQTSAG